MGDQVPGNTQTLVVDSTIHSINEAKGGEECGLTKEP